MSIKKLAQEFKETTEALKNNEARRNQQYDKNVKDQKPIVEQLRELLDKLRME